MRVAQPSGPDPDLWRYHPEPQRINLGPRAAAHHLVRRFWESGSPPARVLRALALPTMPLYRALLAGDRYRRRASVSRGGIPVVSVGNLVAGGTGKTPFVAWLARELLRLGRSSCIVTGTAGFDEAGLHRRWNPELPVFSARKRVKAVRAGQEAGADLAILDDGFQEVDLERDLDILLVAAEDRLTGRTLPAGPYREGLEAMSRADVVVVTSRGASGSRAKPLARELGRYLGSKPIGWVRLEADRWLDLAGAPPRSRREGWRWSPASPVQTPS